MDNMNNDRSIYKNVVSFRYTGNTAQVGVRSGFNKSWIDICDDADVNKYKYLFLDKKYFNLVNKNKTKIGIKRILSGKKYIKCFFNCNWKPVFEKLVGLGILHDEILEADVSVETRFFVDNDVEFGDMRVLFYDIEQDDVDLSKGREDRLLLSIALCGEDDFELSIINKTGDEAGEIELLNKFISILNEFDLLVGWNSSNYDDVVINAKIIKYFGYSLSNIGVKCLDMMKLFEKYWGTGAEVKKSLSLNNVAKEVLGEEKIKFDGSIYNLYLQDVNKLIQYNLQDVKLLKKLEKETGFIESAGVLANICNCLLSNNTILASNLVDCYLLKIGSRRNYRFKTKNFSVKSDENDTKITGAYCENFKNGLINNVEVYDFKSLYPSLMLTFNISPDTKLPNDFDGDCYITSNNIKFCKNTKGIYTELLETALKNRAKYRSEGRDKIANAWKILANSLAGVNALVSSRYYDVDIFEAITKTGKELIQLVIEEAKNKGLKLVFSDTDSIAVIGCDESKYLSDKKFVDDIVRDRFKIENKYLVLNFDAKYSGMIVTTKKRYIARRDDGKLIVKGLEIVRTDTCKLARELQLDICNSILDGLDVDIIYNKIKLIKDMCYSYKLNIDDLVIWKKIAKEQYKSDLVHTKISNHIKSLGKEIYIGMKIGYIIVKSDPKLEGVWIEEYDFNRDKYDADYYWHKLIYPPIARVLEVVYKDNDKFGEFIDTRCNMKRKKGEFNGVSSLGLFDNIVDKEENKEVDIEENKEVDIEEDKKEDIDCEVSSLSKNSGINEIGDFGKIDMISNISKLVKYNLVIDFSGVLSSGDINADEFRSWCDGFVKKYRCENRTGGNFSIYLKFGDLNLEVVDSYDMMKLLSDLLYKDKAGGKIC